MMSPNILALLPEYILAIAGILIMLIEATLKPATSRKPLGWLAIVASTCAGIASWYQLRFGVLTMPVDRFTFAIIALFAVAFRLVTLFPDPYLSTDVYRYAWDGVVQHAHISPYRYVPGDPALTFLRAPNQNLFDHINRRDYAHTIYPVSYTHLIGEVYNSFSSPTFRCPILAPGLRFPVFFSALLLQSIGMVSVFALSIALTAWKESTESPFLRLRSHDFH